MEEKFGFFSQKKHKLNKKVKEYDLIHTKKFFICPSLFFGY